MIQDALHSPADLRIESAFNQRLVIIYLDSVVDRASLHDTVRVPLMGLDQQKADCEVIMRAIPQEGRAERDNLESCLNDLLQGSALIHINGNKKVYSYQVCGSVGRKPQAPGIERTIRGPRIDFVENLEDSLSLVRRRVKDTRLRIDGLTVGKRTKTDLAVIYLADVADEGIVSEVFTRLKRIDIDGIVESGYIEQLITDNPKSVFPLTQSTERPDKAVSAILEGRVVIMADGSQWAIVVPTTLNELYQSTEDYYFHRWIGTFLRFLRILGNNVAVVLPGAYIALVGVNPELLPTQLALTISGSRTGVALPLLIELLAMEITIEMFREASLRLPIPVAQTLGATSGIVLGLAAVRAGLVSDATLVVLIITAIASFSGPNYSIGLAWRLLKYAFIIAAAVFGLFGLTVVGLVLVAHAAIQNSFGIPYLAPWAPLDLPGLGDTVIRRVLHRGLRPETYRPRDAVRFRTREGENRNEE